MKEEIEIWKPILSLDSQYEASSCGRIRRKEYTRQNKLTNGLSRYKVKIIKPSSKKMRGGYLQFTASVNGIKKNVLVHRVVAEAFIPNLKLKEMVNHFDGNTSNNNTYNLEWVTPHENNQHYEKWLRGKIYKRMEKN